MQTVVVMVLRQRMVVMVLRVYCGSGTERADVGNRRREEGDRAMKEVSKALQVLWLPTYAYDES